ncbi:MAG TPA: hypothetical protein VHW93_07970, partial [Acidimicrobiales bacterium]|nr:hypothetical protein [Acidimicrobiales bacterium]
MKSLRRAMAAPALIIVALAAVMVPSAGAAAHGGKVGPDQYFTGVINGTNGNTANPITIDVVCPVTAGSGMKGHPAKGQTLAVHQLFPPGTTSSVGKTGNDSTIDVFFNVLPPGGGAGARAASKTTSFTRYDKTKKMSTKILLPCSGTGSVNF